MTSLNYIWGLPRAYKRLISVTMDAFFVVASFCAAYWSRTGYANPFENQLTWYVVIGTLIVTVFAFTRLGLYRSNPQVSYISRFSHC